MGQMIESLESRCMLSGVTLVTHGYQPTSSVAPAWVDAMTQDIANWAGAGTTIYRLHINSSGSADPLQLVSGSGVATGGNGEAVILLDWAAASGIVTSYFSTAALAQTIKPYLLQTFPTIGISQPLAQSPIHLVGHSRGGSLVSALAGELGKEGLWVDQLTTLDPHPVGSDSTVVAFNNVVFADNYYQTTGSLGDLYTTGSTVAGAHNLDLTFLGVAHAGVHAYYDGTIDVSAINDGDGTTIASNWYAYSSTGPRNNVGFKWSRLGAGTRPTDGLLTSGASRVALTPTATGAAEWDNLMLPDLLADVTLTQGTSLTPKAVFLDRNKDATLTVGFDLDTNPYNGTFATGATTTAAATTSPWSPNLSTSSLAPGTYRVFARISNGTRTRYYYAPGKVTLTAPPDTAVPIATSVSKTDITAPGTASLNITVTCTDNIAINTASLDSNDVLVTGPNGFAQTAQFVAVDNTANGTPRTATYRLAPPGGAWDAADNGTYYVRIQSGQIADTSGNTVVGDIYRLFNVNIPAVDTARPTVSASSAANVTAAGATSHTMTLTFADNVAVKVSTLDSWDLIVTGPGGFSQAAQFLSLDNAADGTPRTATYRITPPGGSWDAADNGTYTLSLQANQVTDTSGNGIAAVAALRTFTVSVPATADTARPSVSGVSLANVTAPGATLYTFSVTYADNVAINTASLDGADIRVTGPGGYSQLAQFVSVNSTANGTPRTATYRMVPPGGSWDTADNGTYTLSLQASQVSDTSGNLASAVAALRTFNVTITSSSSGAIAGTVFHDVEGDGVRGAADVSPLVATLYLDLNNNGLLEGGEPFTTSSPRSGKYAFTSVSPGSYVLRQVPPAGYRQTLPRRYYSVTVASGQTVAGLDFGDTTLAYLSGRVWNDADADRAIDAGEAGLAGWRVFLDLNNDGIWQKSETSAITDADGYFVFKTLGPGRYTARLVPQSGWIATSRLAQPITLAAGQVINKLAYGQRRA